MRTIKKKAPTEVPTAMRRVLWLLLWLGALFEDTTAGSVDVLVDDDDRVT